MRDLKNAALSFSDSKEDGSFPFAQRERETRYRSIVSRHNRLAVTASYGCVCVHVAGTLCYVHACMKMYGGSRACVLGFAAPVIRRRISRLGKEDRCERALLSKRKASLVRCKCGLHPPSSSFLSPSFFFLMATSHPLLRISAFSGFAGRKQK